ncbi:HlyC/CorC family transporter [Nodosilinea sp. LEGE 07088]|uniref:hemolysin family protein n=1 Tax=Nodosilinea sp. LEGE 07088 TaxID=2777968 RepID=UPI00187E3D1B|nr:hemolysin family protein [Nodosilinea sp. LEGE 07088]MBE9136256.1 HlyC/CorC family transporter [Nodosilinea sp. LEGE 07088]
MCVFPSLSTVVIPDALPAAAIVSRLLAVVVLIGINAFFVAAEFSMVSVRRSRISQLVSQGDVQAKTVQQLQRSLDRLLSTTQFGITLSSLALGWVGEGTIAIPLAFWITQTPLTTAQSEALAHALAIPLAFFLVAYLQIVLGELCPKSVAMLYPEQVARFLGPPSLTIARLFNPFIWVLNQSTRLLLRLANIQYSNQVSYSRLTPEELQLIIRTTAETPGLEAEERALLNNVFEFREVTAGEVMVPRTQISAIALAANFRELLEVVVDTEHSRYPVMGDSLDDIQGMVELKQFLQPLARQQITLETPIAPWVKPARFVPEYTPLHELLATMQRTGQELVIVVDEFGGTGGLLTLRDLTTEIIGKIHEPDDHDDDLVQVVDELSYRIKAHTDLEEVNELLNLDLPYADDYQTLGGFLIYQMQKIPHAGERLMFADREWVILSTDGPRLEDILVRQINVPPSPLAPRSPSPPHPTDA